MADEELAKILSRRFKIIGDDEMRNNQESNTNDPNNIQSSQNNKTLSIKPTLPPKPKLDSHALQQIHKLDKYRNVDTSDSIPTEVVKPTAPVKPPRLFVKPIPEKNSERKAISETSDLSERDRESMSYRLIDDDDNDDDDDDDDDDYKNEEAWKPVFKVWNPYIEFKEMTRKEIQKCQQEFQKYDRNADKFLDLDELKMMMEKIGLPQTHIAIKSIMKEVDEDKDNKICFREFLLIFQKVRINDLPEDSCLFDLYKHLNEIDVDKEGVGKAKNFFEAKITNLTKGSRFEEEIKEEVKGRKMAQEENKRKKAVFNETVKMFEHT